MKGRNEFIAFIIMVAIIAGVLYVKNRNKSTPTVVPTAPPSVQLQLQNKFNGLTVPTGAGSIELKDVSGGTGMGIATKTEILADLKSLSAGQSYQAYLADPSGKTVLLGTLKMSKGGWILDYDSSKFPGYNKIIVSQGNTHILEGSF